MDFFRSYLPQPFCSSLSLSLSLSLAQSLYLYPTLCLSLLFIFLSLSLPFYLVSTILSLSHNLVLSFSLTHTDSRTHTILVYSFFLFPLLLIFFSHPLLFVFLSPLPWRPISTHLANDVKYVSLGAPFIWPCAKSK